MTLQIETPKSAAPVLRNVIVPTVTIHRVGSGHPNALSPREWQVLLAIVSGETRSEIAKRLNLSLRTVETYRARIFKKTGASSTAQLAISAYAQGIVL